MSSRHLFRPIGAPLRRDSRLFLLLLLGAFSLSRAFADAECVAGYHDMTPDETATMTAVLESARSAVPPPPSGWVDALNDDSVVPPRSVCLDFSPWTYSYGRHYRRVEGAEERQQAIDAAGADFKAAVAQKQPRIDALMAEGNALSAEFAEAATSGDNARVEAINAEMERISAEIQRVMNEDDSMAAYEAATASHYVDLEMSVSVHVNSGGEAPADGAQPIEIGGATSAWQWTSGDNNEYGHALVLFGNWRMAASGYGLEPAGIPGAAPEQPQAIAVKIYAYPDRLPSMIEATDFGALAGLLKR